MSFIVSIIIPTYRDWETLNACLINLQNQTIPKSSFEIIIVNNDPSDIKPDDLTITENTKIISESKPGSYAARNKGILEAKGNVLAFTDSDCLPTPNWIENALEYLEDGFDLVGGEMEFFKSKKGSDLAFLYEKKFGFNQKRNVEEKGQSITANLFCSRKVIDAVGLFPEGLMSGGDFVWTKKATTAGFKMAFGKNVLVKHPTRKSIAEIVRKKKRTIGGMYSRFYKNYSPKQKLKFGLHFVRPHISIFTYNDLSILEKTKLFFATWYVECLGMREMILLDFKKKTAERS